MTQTLENMASSGSRTPRVNFVETESGSVYRYLPNGKTQRTIMRKNPDGTGLEDVRPEKDILVFIPDYEHLDAAKRQELDKFTKSAVRDAEGYERTLGLFKSTRGICLRVTDETGKILNTNKEASEAKGQIYLSFVTHITEGQELEGGREELRIPVSKGPVVGFYPFDSEIAHAYGKLRRKMHVGHKVARVNYEQDK